MRDWLYGLTLWMTEIIEESAWPVCEHIEQMK